MSWWSSDWSRRVGGGPALARAGAPLVHSRVFCSGHPTSRGGMKCVFMQEGICVSGDREVGGTERGSFLDG